MARRGAAEAKQMDIPATLDPVDEQLESLAREYAQARDARIAQQRVELTKRDELHAAMREKERTAYRGEKVTIEPEETAPKFKVTVADDGEGDEG